MCQSIKQFVELEALQEGTEDWVLKLHVHCRYEGGRELTLQSPFSTSKEGIFYDAESWGDVLGIEGLTITTRLSTIREERKRQEEIEHPEEPQREVEQ